MVSSVGGRAPSFPEFRFAIPQPLFRINTTLGKKSREQGLHPAFISLQPAPFTPISRHKWWPVQQCMKTTRFRGKCCRKSLHIIPVTRAGFVLWRERTPGCLLTFQNDELFNPLLLDYIEPLFSSYRYFLFQRSTQFDMKGFQILWQRDNTHEHPGHYIAALWKESW